MLRFVSLERTRVAQGAVAGAYLLGQDNVAIAGEVTGSDNIIHCEKTTSEAAALALQVDLREDTLEILGDDRTVEGVELTPLGVLMLQTCLLPERDKPYLLTIELARHRIMLLLTKLEEWGAFEHAEGSLAMRLLARAREAFVQALVHAQDSVEPDSPAAVHGLRALWIAIEASERLTLLQTQHDFAPRMNATMYESVAEDPPEPAQRTPVLHPSRGGVVLPMKPMLGAAVSPSVFAPTTTDAIIKSSDFITVPMRWVEMEPAEGDYDYSKTDRWIEWAIRTAKLPVVAGPLVDFRTTSVPDWLYIWENDYETLRELVYEHIKALVTRYRRTVTRWTVCSGLHCGKNFKLSFEQMMDLTRICVLVARKLHPRAKIQVEITQPWGEYHTKDRATLPPLLYAEMLSQAGVQLDAFSLRMQMGSYRPGLQTRDLMAFSDLLDRYAMLDRPITISSFGAPVAPVLPRDPAGDEPSPGSWRQDWNEQTQAAWLRAYGAVALSKPFVESVCWHELADPIGPSDMRTGGLIDSRGQSRSALTRMIELRDMLRSGKLDPTWSEGALAADPQPAGG
jgi:hypothetical protein